MARSRIKRLSKAMPEERGILPVTSGGCGTRRRDNRPVMKPNDDIGTAMQMAMEIEELLEHFQGLDCGSCQARPALRPGGGHCPGPCPGDGLYLRDPERLRELLRHIREQY